MGLGQFIKKILLGSVNRASPANTTQVCNHEGPHLSSQSTTEDRTETEHKICHSGDVDQAPVGTEEFVPEEAWPDGDWLLEDGDVAGEQRRQASEHAEAKTADNCEAFLAPEEELKIFDTNSPADCLYEASCPADRFEEGQLEKPASQPLKAGLEESILLPPAYLHHVQNLSFTKECRRALQKMRVEVVGDLVRMLREGSIELTDCGPAVIREFVLMLDALGLSAESRLYGELLIPTRKRTIRRRQSNSPYSTDSKVAGSAQDEYCFLEVELDRYLNVAGSSRNRAIVASYLGWDGGDKKTLAAVGREFGITRARVGQLVTRVVSACRRACATPETLLRARAIVQAASAANEEDIERKLVNAGITKIPIRLHGINRALKAFKLSSAAQSELLSQSRRSFEAESALAEAKSEPMESTASPSRATSNSPKGSNRDTPLIHEGLRALLERV